MQNSACREIKSSFFKEYVISKGIRIVDSFENNDVDLYNLSQHQIINQLTALKEFHKMASGYVGYSRERIKTCIGKNIEKYKLEVRKAESHIKYIKTQNTEEGFEEFLLGCMEENIKIAKKCLKLIYENGYIDLIMRSMKGKEVCIGDSSFSNLRLTDAVEVISIDDCSFNLVEDDAVYLLRKIKRKKAKVDYKNAVEEFCKLEGLDEKSRIYILALLSFPHEFMKYCGRLRENEKRLSNFEWKHKLTKARIMDGESLI